MSLLIIVITALFDVACSPLCHTRDRCEERRGEESGPKASPLASTTQRRTCSQATFDCEDGMLLLTSLLLLLFMKTMIMMTIGMMSLSFFLFDVWMVVNLAATASNAL